MENLNLIRKVAYSFTKSNIEFDELFSEAALAYCEAMLTFDSDKGVKFTTHATNYMKNRLIYFCQYNSYVNPITGKMVNRKKDHILYEGNDLVELYENPASRSLNELNDIMNEWSEDCQLVAYLLLDNEEQLTAQTPNYKRKNQANSYRTKLRISKELQRMDMNWDKDRIQNTFEELKIVVNSL